MKKYLIIFMCFLVIAPGCANMSNMGKGGVIGGAAGTALGAGVGALIGKGKGAAIGAAIGGAVGSGAGLLIGRKMDAKAAELEAALENAKVETVQDQNGLQAIKVTFDSGILFATGKSALTQVSKNELTEFATQMRDMADADITIYGHTDNTGSAAINEKLSKERAESVKYYLVNQGIAPARMTSEGMSFNMPVADNSTAEGRAQNRRVELYVTASHTMIQQAENGTLR